MVLQVSMQAQNLRVALIFLAVLIGQGAFLLLNGGSLIGLAVIAPAMLAAYLVVSRFFIKRRF